VTLLGLESKIALIPFLRVVGSELIQKYLGDGPKLVREIFRVVDDLSHQLSLLMKLML
jgi:ATP-dependent 26S proteasome regulatory subunit